MEDEKIKVVNQWLELKSVRDIQVFFRFANFYWQFIQNFSYIAMPLITMLKTTKSIESEANLKETKGKASYNSVISHSMVSGGEATNQTNSIKEKN